MFEHEKLQVYLLSRELNREIWRISKISSRGYSDHLDQLVRAGSSITRNLAEGSGEWSPKEKAKFYRYAKRSACEAAAALDVLVDYGMLRDHDTMHAKELLRRIVPMVVKLVQIFEGGAPSRPTKHPKSPSLSPSTGPRIPSPGPGPWPDPERID